MKFKKTLPSILSVGVLLSAIFTVSILSNGEDKALGIDRDQDSSQVTSVNGQERPNNFLSENNGEMRAVWIPYIDLKLSSEFSEEKFKENYKNILGRVINTKLNTVIVQVRPFSDALYPSKIFPWSHILTGIQGKDPGFDPLKFMIEEAHSKGLKFHAWVVPMRIKNGSIPKDFSDTNPYIKLKKDNPELYRKYIIESDEITCYDPKYTEVRQIIIDGVKEIVENYEVDGISFDDYFYPEDNLWVDRKDYRDQKISQGSEISESSIREHKESVNLLISGVYQAIKSIKKDVVFGVCPQGNFENSRKAGADIDTWAKNEGYVDYLCPEIYTNSTNPVLPFERAVSDWRQLITCSKIKFYVGLGLYKTGTDKYDNGTWLKSDSIIMEQIKYARENGCNGFALYSSVYLDKDETHKEVVNTVKIIN